MGAADPYNKTDKLDNALLETIVTRLEGRGNHPFFVKMMHEYLDAMDIDTKGVVLDLGCGTGVAARGIAARPGFSGTVLGIDLSPYLVQAAERFAAQEGYGGSITFQTGDTRSLDLEDTRFDAVVAHTLVSHVEDPLTVVREASRVVKHGGMVGIFDGDYASMTMAQQDLEKNKRDDEALIKGLITSPQVMRQMPRLLQESGLELVTCFPYVLAEVGKADFWGAGIESYKRIMPVAGTMSEEEANIWAEDLVEASEKGMFFGASNFYGYVARKP